MIETFHCNSLSAAVSEILDLATQDGGSGGELGGVGQGYNQSAASGSSGGSGSNNAGAGGTGAGNLVEHLERLDQMEELEQWLWYKCGVQLLHQQMVQVELLVVQVVNLFKV